MRLTLSDPTKDKPGAGRCWPDPRLQIWCPTTHPVAWFVATYTYFWTKKLLLFQNQDSVEVSHPKKQMKFCHAMPMHFEMKKPCLKSPIKNKNFFSKKFKRGRCSSCQTTSVSENSPRQETSWCFLAVLMPSLFVVSATKWQNMILELEQVLGSGLKGRAQV